MAVLLLLPCLAWAGEPPRGPKAEAFTHFRAGQRLYDAGEYGKAMAEFTEAYRLHPDPALLFNMGQCARLMGDLDEAEQKYMAYLQANPTAKNRQDVEQRIDELESRQWKAMGVLAAPKPSVERLVPPAELTGAAPAVVPVAGTPVPAATTSETPPGIRVDLAPDAAPAEPAACETPVYTRWWFWAGVTVVAVGVGVGIYAATSNSADGAAMQPN